MRFSLTVFTAIIAITLLYSVSAAAQSEENSISTMAPFSANEAIPVLTEIELTSQNELAMPAGWALKRIIPNGYLLEHTDGSHANITRQAGPGEQLAWSWSVTYRHEGMQCVASQTVRIERPSYATVSELNLPTRPADDEFDQAMSVTLQWPAQVLQSLLNALNAETRHGICVR